MLSQQQRSIYATLMHRASRVCEAVENMPAACGYLPAPSKGSGELKQYWTPSTLRRALEVDIIASAKALNFPALEIYRDHGILLNIFERYDSFLDNPNLYDCHSREILVGGREFPNPLKPLGAAMAGYASGYTNGLSSEAFTEAFTKTVEILCHMGVKKYVSDPHYASKMARDFEFEFNMYGFGQERFKEATRRYLQIGGNSLCLAYDSNLSPEESIQKIKKSLKNMEANVRGIEGPDDRSTDHIKREVSNQFRLNPLVSTVLDIEIESINTALDPLFIFSKLIHLMNQGDEQSINKLSQNTNIGEIIKALYKASSVKLSAEDVLKSSKTIFTPLVALRALDGSTLLDKNPEKIDSVYSATMKAGFSIAMNDASHAFALMRTFETKGAFDIDDVKEFNTTLEAHIAPIGFDATLRGCNDHPSSSNPALIAHAVKLIAEDKAGCIRECSEDTIHRVFVAKNDGFLRKFNLTRKDALLNEGETANSHVFKAQAFSDELNI